MEVDPALNAYFRSLAESEPTHVAPAVQRSEAVLWRRRLIPLCDRLRDLLASIPPEVKAEGIALPVLRKMFMGRYRGHAHAGELGDALRSLGYTRRRAWSDDRGGFRARWFPSNPAERPDGEPIRR